MGFNLDRRLFDLLGTIPTVPGRDRRLPAGRARRGGRGQHRHARRGHRPDHGPVPVALARRLRARRHPPGPRRRPACASSGDSATGGRTAPCRPCGRTGARSSSAAIRQVRPVTCLTYLTVFHVLLPLIAPVGRLLDLRSGVLNPVQGDLVLAHVRPAPGARRRVRAAARRGTATPPCAYCRCRQVVYRQLMYLVTIQSVITALIGTRQRWQAISRAGVFANPPA